VSNAVRTHVDRKRTSVERDENRVERDQKTRRMRTTAVSNPQVSDVACESGDVARATHLAARATWLLLHARRRVHALIPARGARNERKFPAGEVENPIDMGRSSIGARSNSSNYGDLVPMLFS
jgi:hypothetical protein